MVTVLDKVSLPHPDQLHGIQRDEHQVRHGDAQPAIAHLLGQGVELGVEPLTAPQGTDDLVQGDRLQPGVVAVGIILGGNGLQVLQAVGGLDHGAPQPAQNRPGAGAVEAGQCLVVEGGPQGVDIIRSGTRAVIIALRFEFWQHIDSG